MNHSNAVVVSVNSSESHSFSKYRKERIFLLPGLGVEGDAHCGTTVKHRSRMAVDPRRPNLRQIHLLHAELFDQLYTLGFTVTPGDLGENITTRNLSLLSLPTGTQLVFAGTAVVELTGLRNPCPQIDLFQPGLLAAVIDRDNNGKLTRKCGVMGVVVRGGWVEANDPIQVQLPTEPHLPLTRV